MSNSFTSLVQSPGPGWATLREPTPAESDVEVIDDPRPKKRKNGEGLHVHGRGDPRSSAKRPRHTIFGPEISGTSKSGQTGSGSATDPVNKPSTASTSPDRPRSASSFIKQGGSTASNLAALYQPSQRSIDPLIARWRETNRAAIKQPIREQTTRKLVSEKKQQMEWANGPKKHALSQTLGSSSTANSVKHHTNSESGSGSRAVALEDETSARGAKQKDGHFPMRQIARKTGAGSGPPKKHFFDRQVISNNDNASDESLPVGSDSGLASSSLNEVAQVQPLKHRRHARKGLGGGPWKIPQSKRRNSAPEVIVVESSSDESTSAKVLRKTRPNQQSITAHFSPGVSKRIERAKGKQAYGASNVDLPMAIDRKGKGKSLLEDIIDLTLDDSDEISSSGLAATGPAESPSNRLNSDVVIPILPGSPAKMPLINRVPGSPSIKSPSLQSTPMKGFTRRKTMAAVVSSPLNDEPGPRSRSVPPLAGPDLPMVAETSRSTASMSSDEDAPTRFARPSRMKRIIRSPNEEVSDSDVQEEREVYKAVLQGGSLSSNESRNIGEDEDLISAMRTNSSSPNLNPALRASSASSPSEADNVVPFTDVESPPDSSPSPGPEEPAPATLTYGGFKALTWEDHKKDFKNLGLTHYSAKDLPTALPDSINRLSEYTRMNPGLRDVFRAYMLENIMDDEANAPDVEIINNIDLEPTPLFEFVYSNRIWYGEGVPLPDYSKLKGCGCIGKCDPRSKTCSCAQRQRKYCDVGDGCVYDKFGRLKYPGYPIFECNEMCSCDDECRNRVVQHGRKYQVSITKTEKKGWGVFNGSKRIPAGSFIGIYAGELLTDDQSENRGRHYNKIGKTYLFDVDFWHLKPQDNPDDWHNKYTMDAFHAGNFTRFLNHSCDPNARLFPCYINEPDIEKPLLVVFSIRDIEPHEEISFNYMGKYPEEDDDEVEDEVERRLDPVYAVCRCGAKNCVGKFF